MNNLFTNNSNKKNILPSFSNSKIELLANEKVSSLNYKNIFLLRKYISTEGKILPRRLNNLSAKKQRAIANSIKNARIMGFLPFTRQVN